MLFVRGVERSLTLTSRCMDKFFALRNVNSLIIELIESTLLGKVIIKPPVKRTAVVGNAMPKPKNRSEGYIRHRTEKLMLAFNVQRYAHRFCVDIVHSVVFFDGMLFVLHPDDLDECDGEILLSVVSVHGDFISQSQRETLRNRIYNCLKGSP
jgi:hypothetical protein